MPHIICDRREGCFLRHAAWQAVGVLAWLPYWPARSSAASAAVMAMRA